MITVEFSNKKNKYTLSVKGHAGSAEEGKDLVCAGASTLFLTLEKTLNDNKPLTETLNIQTSKGDSHVEAVSSPTGDMTIAYLFYVILNGYQMLADRFPQYLELKY